MTKEDLDFYLDNFRGMLEDLISLNSVGSIKKSSQPLAIAKIEQLEKAYPDKDSRSQITTYINYLFNETLLQLKELDALEQIILLEETKILINQKFKLMSKRSEHISSESLIITLDYLGVLKFLQSKDLGTMEIADLLGLLLDRSPTNIRKAMNGVVGPPRPTNTKNESSLNSVKRIAEKLKINSLLSMVEEDLGKLNQTNKKKG